MLADSEVQLNDRDNGPYSGVNVSYNLRIELKKKTETIVLNTNVGGREKELLWR